MRGKLLGASGCRLAVLVLVTSIAGGAAGCASDRPAGPPRTPGTETLPPTPTTAPPATAPLTGLPAEGDLSTRTAVAVKIDNAGPAKPQAGIDRADIVVEEPVEGGITRLMAIFHSRDVARVGPVRSARVPDAALVRALGGGPLVFSGSSRATARVLDGERQVRLVRPSTGPWRRDRSRPAPHNLYVDLRRVRRSVDGTGPHAVQRQFSFSEQVPPGGETTRSARLRWSATRVTWTWNASARRWDRSQAGRRDVGESGKRLTSRNVVVLQVRSTTDPRFHDKTGALTPLVDLTSGGRAWLLRDGVRIAARWERSGPDAPFQLVDEEGGPLALRPGVTWIELLPAPAAPSWS